MNMTFSLPSIIIPNSIWVAVLIYLVTHPEVAEKWGSIFTRLFSNISKRAERTTVGLGIQGDIDSFAKSLNREVNGVVPYGVQIEWVIGGATRESFFRENKIVIRMDYHTNQDENLVRAALEYVSKGLLTDSKPYLDSKVVDSVDLICTKKLIESQRRGALHFYYGEILNPILESDEDIREYVHMMQQLDEGGYFTQILLKELHRLGVLMHFTIPDDQIRGETRDFVGFLDAKITNKPPGVDVDPTFIGQRIKTSIVYVARADATSVEPHVRWVEKCLQKGVDTIYLCARGEINIASLLDLESRLDAHPKLKKVCRSKLWASRIGRGRIASMVIEYERKPNE